MRIAFSGAANTGKSTLLKSFLYTWNNYSTPSKTYRDIIKEENLSHSSKSNTTTQTAILDFMLDQVQGVDKETNIVYDRCPLDALAYTIWCHEKGVEGFDSKYVQNQITLVKESMRFLDIIFVCKFNKDINIVDDGLRDTDKEYIKEVDNIFESLFQQYFQNLHADVFFPKDDSPCLIKLPDDPQQRIDSIADYLTPEGNIWGEEHSILSPDNLKELEGLVKQQQTAHEAEETEKELFKKFGLQR